MDLMSGKVVKAFIAASQAAMKNRRIRDALVCLMSGKVVKAFIAASQAAMKNRRIRDALVCCF
ncbi:hypothetical protein ASE92_06495 [Pedobacter sp. Leaf41]|nr:hypothetical protein ASE92_06495 [Pedobacter sp. Leaf41]